MAIFNSYVKLPEGIPFASGEKKHVILKATFRKSSHTMFSSYSRPGFWYVTLIGISAQSGGNSWPTANPLNAPPQLSIPYVVPKQLWTLNELKAALIRKFPHLSTEEGQGCQR